MDDQSEVRPEHPSLIHLELRTPFRFFATFLFIPDYDITISPAHNSRKSYFRGQGIKKLNSLSVYSCLLLILSLWITENSYLWSLLNGNVLKAPSCS